MTSRKELHDGLPGISHSVRIGTEKLYIQTEEDENGKLRGIFIRLDKAGGELRVYDVLATCISVGIQHGVPLEVFVSKLKHQRMEPQGITSNGEIPIANSVADYVGQWLEKRYLK